MAYSSCHSVCIQNFQNWRNLKNTVENLLFALILSA